MKNTCVADNVVVESTEGKDWPRGRHEQPIVHPGKERELIEGSIFYSMKM